MNFTFPNNVFFECNRCGLCCGDTQQKTRHILLLELEASKISTETCLPIQEFSKQITDRNPYCYEMEKSSDGRCFFLKENQCSIYTLRPLICRFYPFELKFEQDKGTHVFDFTLECPGICKGRSMTKKDFEELFMVARGSLS